MMIPSPLLSIGDLILMILSVFIILGRLYASFPQVLHLKMLNAVKAKVLLTKQPWLVASLILGTFLLEYFLGAFPDIFSSFNWVLPYMMQGLELLHAILGLWLLIAEIQAVYLWLKDLGDTRLLLQRLLPEIQISLRLGLVALALPILLPQFLFTPALSKMLDITIAAIIIWSVVGLLIQLIKGMEKVILYRFGDMSMEKYRIRRFYTQARVFRQIIIAGLMVLGVSTTLMLFDNIREIGTSLLASAGVASAILVFAAQKTLGNLFAGLQIALTQPIKINDALVLEGEFGTVEEITLTYVVLKIWDLRRLVLPINYFIEKPFQNFTMHSTNLLCPVIFFADYRLPIEPVRKAFKDILAASSFWDGNVAVLQVTDGKDREIQLRALASAKDPGSSWNLRCEVLEKLIAFIVEHYPDCLPHIRIEQNRELVDQRAVQQ